MKYQIRTERLGLRNWQDDDTAIFASICRNKQVMKFFPSTLNYEQSLHLIDRFKIHFKEYGFTYFAVDRLDRREFIGFIGLLSQHYESHFTPCVDIGWRLVPNAWGHGFATEGALACIKFGFESLRLSSIYAIAPKINVASLKVMKKIGMKYHSTFEHPKLVKTDNLNPCEVYLIKNEI